MFNVFFRSGSSCLTFWIKLPPTSRLDHPVDVTFYIRFLYSSVLSEVLVHHDIWGGWEDWGGILWFWDSSDPFIIKTNVESFILKSKLSVFALEKLFENTEIMILVRFIFTNFSQSLNSTIYIYFLDKVMLVSISTSFRKSSFIFKLWTCTIHIYF